MKLLHSEQETSRTGRSSRNRSPPIGLISRTSAIKWLLRGSLYLMFIYLIISLFYCFCKTICIVVEMNEDICKEPLLGLSLSSSNFVCIFALILVSSHSAFCDFSQHDLFLPNFFFSLPCTFVCLHFCLSLSFPFQLSDRQTAFPLFTLPFLLCCNPNNNPDNAVRTSKNVKKILNHHMYIHQKIDPHF